MKRYKVEDFLSHMEGSGGIVSTIAQRVGCDWNTVDRWIQRSVTLKALFDAEREKGLDLAESVVLKNIQLAMKRQNPPADSGIPAEIVDASDAKWLLSKRGRRRGYAERQDMNVVDVNLSELTDGELDRLESGDDPLAVLATARRRRARETQGEDGQ